MKTLPLALAAAALLGTSGAAVAQGATDARCVILSNVFAKAAKDPQAQKMAEASMYFYLGRMGSASSAQLKSMFDAQSKTITDANAGTLMGECVKALQSEMQQIQTIAGQSQPAARPAPKSTPSGR